MEQTGVGTLVVVTSDKRLAGLLTERDVRFVAGDQSVAQRMTPREKLVAHAGPISFADAERSVDEREVNKLTLVCPVRTVIVIIVEQGRYMHLEYRYSK